MTDTLTDFHADDYALSSHSDADILELCRQGLLDSISMLPNMSCFSRAAEDFKRESSHFPHKVLVSIHLNFMEGKCCAAKESVPHLVDESGYFTVTWGKLLIWSFLPFIHSVIRDELACEIEAQTERMIAAGITDRNAVRYDSHQHPHMIPIVFDALLQAIDRNGYQAAYIRNAEDPLHCYLKAFPLFKTYSIVNGFKCIILNTFVLKVRHALRKRNLPVNYLCGVFFSSHMDAKRLEKILPAFFKKSKRKQRPLEILFHPGHMLAEELNADFTKAGRLNMMQ